MASCARMASSSALREKWTCGSLWRSQAGREEPALGRHAHRTKKSLELLPIASCEQSRTEGSVAVAASRVPRLAVTLRWSDCLEDTGAIRTFALHGAQADHTKNDTKSEYRSHGRIFCNPFVPSGLIHILCLGLHTAWWSVHAATRRGCPGTDS